MVVYDDASRDRMRRFKLDRAEYAVSPPKQKEPRKENQLVVREKNKQFENQLSQRLSNAIRTGDITPSRKIADRIIDDGKKPAKPKPGPAFTPIGHTPLKRGGAGSGSSESSDKSRASRAMVESRSKSRGRRRSMADDFQVAATAAPRSKSRRRSVVEEEESRSRSRHRSERRSSVVEPRGKSQSRQRSSSRRRSSSRGRRDRRSEEEKVRQRAAARASKGTGGRKMLQTDIVSDVAAHPFELARLMDERDPGKRQGLHRHSQADDRGLPDGAMYDKSLGPIAKEASMVYEAEYQGGGFDVHIHESVKAKPERPKHNRSRGMSERLSAAENFHYTREGDVKVQGRASRPNYPVKPQMRLILADEENQRWVITSGSPPFTIGRSSKCNIVLNKTMHPSVSAVHLTISFNQQNLYSLPHGKWICGWNWALVCQAGSLLSSRENVGYWCGHNILS